MKPRIISFWAISFYQGRGLGTVGPKDSPDPTLVGSTRGSYAIGSREEQLQLLHSSRTNGTYVQYVTLAMIVF